MKPAAPDAGTTGNSACAGEGSAARAARFARSVIDDGLRDSARDPRLKIGKRAQWDRLRAEAAFLDPSLDALDDFYRTAGDLMHGRVLDPSLVVALLCAYAVSLGLPPREVELAVRTSRLP